MNRWKHLHALFLLLLLAALPVLAQSTRSKAANFAHEGDFFIVSSVNLQKKQLLLKMPSEVTEVIYVDEKTVYLDGAGKPIHLSDLRAGDTVYIVSTRTSEGPLARRIRKGPMTVEVLHQRYLRGTP